MLDLFRIYTDFSDIFHNIVYHRRWWKPKIGPDQFTGILHTLFFFFRKIHNITQILWKKWTNVRKVSLYLCLQYSHGFRFCYCVSMFHFFFFSLFTGRPQPQVRWLVNGVLVDDQYEHNTGDVIENRLLWPAVQRSDLNAIFTCQAVNTILVEPKENSYVLDLHCKYYFCFSFYSFPHTDNNRLFFHDLFTFEIIYWLWRFSILFEKNFVKEKYYEIDSNDTR